MQDHELKVVLTVDPVAGDAVLMNMSLLPARSC